MSVTARSTNFGLFSIVRDAHPITLPRQGSLLVDEDRPPLRGRLMGWMYRSNAWLLIASVYLFIKLPAALDYEDVVIRLAYVAAVQFNLQCSEYLHNADLIQAVPTKLFELNAYRYDQVSISLIMTTSGFLLGKRLLFGGPIAAAQTAQVGFTLLVTLIQVVMFTPALLKKDEATWKSQYHLWTMSSKAVLAVQFILLGGTVVRYGYSIGPPMAHLWVGPTVVYAIYVPGMLFFAAKDSIDGFLIPRTGGAGHHEMFHFFCLGGYLTTLIMDCVLW